MSFYPICMILVPYSCLIALAKTTSTTLKREWDDLILLLTFMEML